MALYIKLMEGRANRLGYFDLKQHNRKGLPFHLFLFVVCLDNIKCSRDWLQPLSTVGAGLEPLILLLLLSSAETTGIRVYT